MILCMCVCVCVALQKAYNEAEVLKRENQLVAEDPCSCTLHLIDATLNVTLCVCACVCGPAESIP